LLRYLLKKLLKALIMTQIDKNYIARLYKSMLLIRRVEEHICEVYSSDAIKSPVHLSIGQESIAVGVCDALNKDDMISNTYRCHATYIAKGGNLNEMMAELYGKSGGCAAGKAGSMHLVDMKNGVMGASAVVGTTVPVAAGYAFAMKQDAKKTGKQRVVVAMFGDGSTEEGVFAETLHFAALHNLPMIFLLENNRLAIHSKLEQRWTSETLVRDRAKVYGLETDFVADGDVLVIRDKIAAACEKIRLGKTNAPIFIECATYRWLEHVGPTDDHDSGYRDLEEYKKWKENDQIARLEKMLGDDAKVIKKQVELELAAAIEFAINSPYPQDNELLKNVYAA
jgi:TPP-dependent pyruvate/acetoin dehydrogenase alpha subunit